MAILNRYILREVAWPTGLALLVVSFIGVASEIRENAEFIPFAYVTATDLLLVAFYFLPTLLSLIVPVAYMMGILLAFGQFAQHSEVVAMKAAGIPLKRVLLPVLAGGAVLAVGAFLLQDRAQPWALARANNLIFVDMPLRATLDTLRPGVMHSFGDWRVFIGSKDPATHTLHNVDILVEFDGEPMTFSAESAQVVGRKILLKNVYTTQQGPKGELILNVWSENEVNLPEIALQRPPGRLRLRTIDQLWADQARLEKQGDLAGTKRKDLREMRLEIGKRLSYPLACLAVALVAAPLAARAPRGGRSYSFAVGFGIVLVFYVLLFATEPRSPKPLIEMLLRSLLPNIVLIAAGLGLLWRVDRV